MENSTLSQESDIISSSALDVLWKELNNSEFQLAEDCENMRTQQSCDSSTFPEFSELSDANQPPVITNSNTLLLTTGNNLSNSVANGDVVRGPTGSSPCTEEYRGLYDFQIKPSGASKRAWSYSEILKKVFIDVNKVLLLQFAITPPEGQISSNGLKVRALLMYTSPDHLNYPVNRCFLHVGQFDSKHEAHAGDFCRCNEFNLVGHVLTTNHNTALYEYNPVSKRHSVTVSVAPFQPEYGDTVVSYRFGCKTSCQGGMSRRPAQIVFTLETDSGEVVGRRTLKFKVCSCPKRDKEREESDCHKTGDLTVEPSAGKRKITTPKVEPVAPGQNGDLNFPMTVKRVKIDPQTIFQEPQLQREEQFGLQQLHQQQYDNNAQFFPDQQQNIQYNQDGAIVCSDPCCPNKEELDRIKQDVAYMKQDVAYIKQKMSILDKLDAFMSGRVHPSCNNS